MKHLTVLITILCFFLTGCENNDPDGYDTDTALLITTHDIDAAGASGFYFNFISGEETDSTESWHISFQMLSVIGTTYKMPNLVLGDVSISEYTNLSYDDITSTPETFQNDNIQDLSALQYGGASEVLAYDMQIHKVSVSNAERVFIIHEPINDTTYKVQFIEYISGITTFKYDAL